MKFSLLKTDVCDLDADNTCKLPFFYNGVWFENCTLTPKDDYWCPTGKHYLFVPKIVFISPALFNELS